MASYNTNSYRRQSPVSSGSTTGWDPDAVLGLIHPSTSNHTCTGKAHSKGRRCKNRVATFKDGFKNLEMLATQDLSKVIYSSDLRNAALYTLCWRHRTDPDQVDTVLAQWCSQLKEWALQNSRPVKAEPRWSFAYSYEEEPRRRFGRVKVEDGPEETLGNILRADYGHVPGEFINMTLPELFELWSEKMAKQDEDHRKVKQEQEQEAQNLKKEKRRREKEAREREEQLKREEEARARAEEERQRREEQKKREQEQKKREQEAQRKAEQLRKESEAREERLRLAKERREKEAAAKAAKEAQIWKESWERYTEAWDAVKIFKSQRCAAKQQIPWPVKSGQLSDVSAKDIKEFFRKAPSKNLVDTAESRFKFINSENMRWHTDKLQQKFGTEIVSGELKETFDTIARVVVELRQEAQRERKA